MIYVILVWFDIASPLIVNILYSGRANGSFGSTLSFFGVNAPFCNSISMTWIAKYNKYSTSTTILILIF